MIVDVRYVNVPVSDALEEFTHRRVGRALRPFRGSVARVDVRLQDVNGPRGGIDKQCSATAELVEIRRPVVVKTTRADAYEAVQETCTRLAESVSRALTRRRWLGRFGVQPRWLETQPSSPTATAIPSDSGVAEDAAQIKVTVTDHERLRRVVDAYSGTRDRDATEALSDELDRAELVAPEQIAGNVVTMNSRVVFRDDETGDAREVALVYPQESNPDAGRISVLAPIGSALLGLSLGQTIDWPIPSGKLKRLRAVRILYQPEEAGHLHL